MQELLDILHPSYVLRNALYGGILTGMVLPLVGVFMYMRRMVFLGVALPQLSAAGIAAAVFWHATFHQDQPIHSDFLQALLGSAVVTTGALLLLAWLESRMTELAEGRMGVLYVFAGAVTILLVASDRIPEVGVLRLLRGDIIAMSDADLRVLISCCALIVSVLWFFRKELLLVSVDRDHAISLGKRVWLWDILLYGLLGTVMSLGVLMVGPLVTFGFLLLPPMIVIPLITGIHLLPFFAAAVGMFIAGSGFLLSYSLDWPTGATDALLGCIVLAIVTAGQWVIRWAKHRISS
ncbi:MAG: hypothetical protein GKS05_02195 [Nitrospirales bacterium]|nr:hypothetical protein [Nitrospirales bacterium]